MIAHDGTVIAWHTWCGEIATAVIASGPTPCAQGWSLRFPDGYGEYFDRLPAGAYAVRHRDGWERAYCGCGAPLVTVPGGALQCPADCGACPTWAEVTTNALAEGYTLWDDTSGDVWALPCAG